MQGNWKKYIPGILNLVGETPSNSEESTNLKALSALGKSLHRGGPSSQSPGAFSLYEVKQ